MFTGIITAVGTIREVRQQGDLRIVIGAGKACLADIGLGALAEAHGQWRRVDARPLGKDSLEVYERA